MRLWDYRLLKVLPDKFIIAQWRECIAIKRQWEKGTLKHRLVSYVKNYNKKYFVYYVWLIEHELSYRGIKHQEKYYDEIKEFCIDFYEDIKRYIYPEHNNRYLKQCYYNLQEKADRGIITKEEWETIKSCSDLYDIDVDDYDHC